MTLEGYLRVARHAGHRERAATLQALADLPGAPAEIAETLRHHHLLSLVRAQLSDEELRARLPGALVDAMASRRAAQRVPVATMLRTFAEVRAALEAAGIPVLLLKGFYFAARFYGGSVARPQYDVDVLVRGRDFRRSVGVLRRLGFAATARDLHSRTLARGGVAVDIHRALRRAPALRLDEDAVWRSARATHVDGVEMRTLSDEYTLVLLTLASFEDLGQGMARVRQLLDAYLLLREMDATTAWDEFFARRARENLAAITVNLLALVVELFDARAAVPRLAAALDTRGAYRVLDGRDEMLALVSAPRKDAASLSWFGRVYPGSLLHYLLWFWAGGFPANLRRLGPAWLGGQLRAAVTLARARRAPGA